MRVEDAGHRKGMSKPEEPVVISTALDRATAPSMRTSLPSLTSTVWGSTHWRDASTGWENVLDHIMTPNTAWLVSNVQVVSTHGLSDHQLVTCIIKVKCMKLLPDHYVYHDVKKDRPLRFQIMFASIACAQGQGTLHRSLCRPMNICSHGAAQQCCPITHRLSAIQRKAGRRWLSLEAMESRRQRQLLERKRRSSGVEADHCEYRKTCRATNHLIVESRHQANFLKFNESFRNARRKWFAAH